MVLKKNIERNNRIWFLYLQECANFLEKNKKKITKLAEIILEKESKKSDKETKKFFMECAYGDIEIRILQYKKTAETYFKNKNMLTDLLDDNSFFTDENKLYRCDVLKEYIKIKKRIKYVADFADDNLVVQDLLRRFYTWPCLCIIKNKTEENFPYYAVTKAIKKIFDIKMKK